MNDEIKTVIDNELSKIDLEKANDYPEGFGKKIEEYIEKDSKKRVVDDSEYHQKLIDYLKSQQINNPNIVFREDMEIAELEDIISNLDN